MKKKTVLNILIVLLLAVMAFCAVKITRELAEYRKGEQTYASLEQYTRPPESRPHSIGTESAEEPSDDFLTVDFTALQQLNPQITAWIYGADGAISYPVPQAQDNDYYLHHLYDRSYNTAGCPFLDYRNSPDYTDFNSIIYGHYMKNGTMFAALSKYKKQAFYDQYPTMQLLTPTGSYTLRLFAGYVSDLEQDSWRLHFDTAEQRTAWLDTLRSRSCFVSDVVPTAEDRIVTLSTCSYEFENARFVAYAILEAAD